MANFIVRFRADLHAPIGVFTSTPIPLKKRAKNFLHRANQFPSRIRCNTKSTAFARPFKATRTFHPSSPAVLRKEVPDEPPRTSTTQNPLPTTSAGHCKNTRSKPDSHKNQPRNATPEGSRKENLEITNIPCQCVNVYRGTRYIPR